VDAPSKLSPLIPAVIVFAALSVFFAIRSDGFLEADGCTHYIYARWAFTYPIYFVDIWGRPLKTALYAPAANLFGLIGVRLTSLCVAIGISLVAYAIARGQMYRTPALAGIFTLASPLVFLHSFSELTELPFALLLGAAFLAYQRRCFWLVAILASLLPLSRPEGFGFLVLSGVLLGAHRKFALLPLLIVPLIAWQFAGAILFNEPENWWRWLVLHWPYAGDSVYARGSIAHFAALLPAVVGPGLFPFMLLGIKSPKPQEQHQARCEWLIAAIPLSILLGHSVLYALGKMASNGEARYMLIAAPFWALLACRGFDRVWRADRVRLKFAVVATLAVAPPLVAQLCYPVLPLVQMDDWKVARELARWYDATAKPDSPKLLCAHPGFFYYADRATLDPDVLPWSRQSLLSAPPGTIILWHDVYGRFNADRDKSVDASTLADLVAAGARVVRPEGLGERLDRTGWKILIK
jgi:hypothetical protein